MTERFKNIEEARKKLVETEAFFENVLKKEIDGHIPLTKEEQVQIKQKSGEYYQYLKNEGFVYGDIAYDVSQNIGFSGQAGNNFLGHAMKSEHPEWSVEQRTEVRYGLIARLVYQDARIRGNALKQDGGYVSTKIIADYHYDSFKASDLSREAWIGSAFQEFSGDGHWLFNYKNGIDVQQMRITEAVIKGEISNGVDARKAMSYMIHAVPSQLDILSVESHKAEAEATINVYKSIFGGLKSVIFDTRDARIDQSSTTSFKFNINGESLSDQNQGYFGDILRSLKGVQFSQSSGFDKNLFSDFQKTFQPSTPTFSSYEIKTGDSLWKIAKEHGTTVQNILSMPENQAFRANPNLIHAGDKVTVPTHLASNNKASAIPVSQPSGAKASTSILDVKSGDFRAQHANKDMSDTWINGLAFYGGGYEVRMPAGILNGDGFKNHGPSAILTSSFRPGAGEISKHNPIFDVDIAIKAFNNVPKKAAEQTNFNFFKDHDFRAMNNLHHTIGAARKYQNIDPIVINLDGKGLKILGIRESSVYFDIDNDGYQEHTSWIKRGNAFLVRDKNNNSRIDDITEIVSEYYYDNTQFNVTSLVTLEMAEGIKNGTIKSDREYLINPFRILELNDFNRDNFIDKQDEIFSKLKLWHDKNENGICDEEELQELSAYNITRISTDSNAVTYEDGVKFISRGNERSDGTLFNSYAINFNANTRGIMMLTIPHAKILIQEIENKNERGNFTLKATEKYNGAISASALNVQHITGSNEDDEIYGDKDDNWLIGGGGKDKIFAGSGDDVLVIDAEDDIEFIDGGDGFDIVYIDGNKDAKFNLVQTSTEVVYGSEGNDLIEVGAKDGVTINGFIDGRGGDDELIGDDESDAISGGDGDDLIFGKAGGDVLRGDRGQDIIFGGDGGDVIFGGDGDDYLYGEAGDDSFEGGPGNDRIFGGDGDDYVKYNGAVEDYEIIVHDGFVTIKDKVQDRDGFDTLYDIENFEFALSSSSIRFKLENLIRPVSDVVKLEGDSIQISASQLLTNDVNVAGKEIYICEVKDAKGGRLEVVKEPNADKIISIKFFYEKSVDAIIRGFSYGLCSPGVKWILEKGSDSDVGLARVYIAEDNHPQDDMFYSQWYLEDIKALVAWKRATGKDIKILVNEPNVDFNHIDLSGKYIDIPESNTTNLHATNVAGLIAAARNGRDLIGVAYDAKIGSTDRVEKSQEFYDIINRSWRSADLKYYQKPKLQEKVDTALILEGRKGLGTIIIQSAGNNRDLGENTNDISQTNDIDSIVIGAINKHAQLSFGENKAKAFSNPGASILVSAPGSHILTSSTVTRSYNGEVFSWNFGIKQGTSFSAPIVAGIVGLMLEANPILTQWDVQKVLAMCATKYEDPATLWQTNAAKVLNFGGLHYSHDYGFGQVDAQCSVKTAEHWPLFSFRNVWPIIEGDFNKTSAIKSKTNKTFEFKIDYEMPVFDTKLEYRIDHRNFSQIAIELESPSGTRTTLKSISNLSLGKRNKFDFEALSKQFLGESTKGIWKVTIINDDFSFSAMVNYLKLYFHYDGWYSSYNLVTSEMKQKPEDHFYTNFEEILLLQNTDEDLDINLKEKTSFSIFGKTIFYSSFYPTAWVLGDGNDKFTGNNNNNVIYGNWGDDQIIAGDDNDVLVGEKGNNILTGNKGYDYFVVTDIEEHTTITDYYPPEDKIIFAFNNYTILKSITSTINGNSCIYSWPGGEGRLILQNTKCDEVYIIKLESKFNYHRLITAYDKYSDVEVVLPEKKLLVSNTKMIPNPLKTQQVLINSFYDGSEDGDRFESSAGNNLFITFGGDDYIRGGDGTDIIFVGDGDDKVMAGNGNNFINGGKGNNTLSGGNGIDVYIYSHALEGGFYDRIFGFSFQEDKLDFRSTNLDKATIIKHSSVSKCESLCEKHLDVQDESHIRFKDWSITLANVNLKHVGDYDIFIFD